MTDAPIPARKRELPATPADISGLRGVLSEDLKKVKITVELSLDSTRPDLELILEDKDGNEVSRSTIIENFGGSINFTMHVRHNDIPLPLKLTCRLSYTEEAVQAEKSVFVEQLA